ncbi:MAG: sulfite exporter TauE/SafE family protein [Halanaeroarchaeum sp.]
MAIGGVSLATIATFAGFGVLVGLIFGFFGMGSFLVPPILLVMGYDSTVAVGSGLAFVFGTAVIATLKHRDLDQVHPRLGVVTIVGTTLGIEVGKRGLLALRDAGMAVGVVGGAYVLLLGAVGTLVIRDALSAEGTGEPVGEEDRVTVPEWVSSLAEIDPIAVPADWLGRIVPFDTRISLPGGGSIAVWSLFAITFVTGVPAGLLGIGGGFMRIPALTYLVGVPMSIAVGTNVFALAISGGIGAFSWAQAGGVDLSIVAPLLLGSALGARLGSTITDYVPEGSSRIYFGAMLILSAVAVATKRVGARLDVPWLRLVGIALIVGSALIVSALVLRAAVTSIRDDGRKQAAPSD